MTPTDHTARERGRSIAIRIDNRPFHVLDGDMTGAELKDLAEIPADYQLFEEIPGPEPDRGIRDDEVVGLHEGAKFYGLCAGTLG